MSKPLIITTGIFATLLLGWTELQAGTWHPPQAACTASTTVQADYLFFHALAASHPSLFERRSDYCACPARKVIRT